MRFHILRRLSRQPSFTLMMIVTLALGIGANSAIFAVINSVLLKPLPYPRAEELVDLNQTAPGVSLEKAGSAPFLYLTYKAESKTLQSLGLWRSDTDSLTGLAEPEEVPSLQVTEDVLTTLEVQPMLGRNFNRNDTTPGTNETVIVSYSFWQRKFGGAANIIGRGIMLDGRPREIIGVLPRTFQFLDRKPELLMPLRLDPSKTYLGNFSYQSIGRLKPGVTIAQLSADMERMIPISLASYPPFPGFSLKMFHDARLAPSIQPLKQRLLGDINKVLWVLMGTVGIVLLIAGANVINLMFVRAQGRQHELAIRSALGAGRRQIARELFMESITVGLIGGVAGLTLAYGALRLLVALAPSNLPRLAEIGFDIYSLLFTIGLSVAAGALFGLILSLKYTAPKLSISLRAGGRSMSQSREHHRARNTLVVVQVALALVLLISSGLMIRTFQSLRHIDPGFSKPEELQTFGVYIPPASLKEPEKVVRMEQEIIEKLAALPGVTSAAMASAIPMTNNNWSDPIFAEDHAYEDSKIPALRSFRIVSPGLLKTMGNALVLGRDFTWDDVYGKRNVVLVSENLARELWGSPRAAIGKRVRENMKGEWREIVGVVGDERDNGVDKPAPTTLFLPMMMGAFEGDSPYIQRGGTYIVRSSRAGTSAFMTDIGKAVWSVNANLPLASVRTIGEIYEKSMARTSFALVMLGIASGTALLLGIAGIYGVVSYSVSQRTREVGIRRALGAQSGEVAGMFVKQAARLALVGIACGFVLALVVVRLMSSLLFNVSSTDPVTYAAVSLSLAVAAVLAAYIPALRATGINPIDALRSE